MPCAVCRTSGWNWTPKKPRSRSSMPATGVTSVLAVTVNPDGALLTKSRWDIHTACSCGSPANSMPGDVTATVAPPYSATSEFSTVPPRACAITWWP